MFIAVFKEFAHPEVLEEVKKRGICDVDVAPEVNKMATTEQELRVLRTNVKLITVTHNIAGMREVFDSMTQEEFLELSKRVDEKVGQLEELGFKVVERNPMTSAGSPMLDRVIMLYPE